MSVDNYAAAIALTEKIKECLPIAVRPSPELIKLLEKQGAKLPNHKILTIDSVVYLGDEGGISCGIKPEQDSKQVHIVSITHLIIDATHPLAPEIQAYQRQRVRALRLQNSRGFMAEMNRLSDASARKKKKGDRGFGQ